MRGWRKAKGSVRQADAELLSRKAIGEENGRVIFHCWLRAEFEQRGQQRNVQHFPVADLGQRRQCDVAYLTRHVAGWEWGSAKTNAQAQAELRLHVREQEPQTFLFSKVRAFARMEDANCWCVTFDGIFCTTSITGAKVSSAGASRSMSAVDMSNPIEASTAFT